MKKFYSIVLMATALLIGTNMQATVRTAGSAQELETAWKNAQTGDEIKLTASFSISKTLWLGTANMYDTPLSITLNLNGDTLSSTAEKVFVLSHGSLNVIGNGGIKHNLPYSTVYSTSEKEYLSKYEIFRVLGSTYKDINPDTTATSFYTHLSIGAGVKLVASVNGIVVDQLSKAPFENANACAAGNKAFPTWANLYTNVYTYKKAGDRGVANGVRIDVAGTIHANKYAIKANGNLGSTSNTPLTSYANYYQAQNVQYSVAAGDNQYSPFIYIKKTAELLTLQPERNDAVAAYGGGYARWLVQGHCEGSTGVYVKSGEVVLQDAVVASNYKGDEVYTGAKATNSGVQCGGSGIVMESSNVYAGDIDVTVKGDTKVTATTGYAVDEAVTAVTGSKVDAITIEGGTFESGDKGTLKVSEATATAAAASEETKITILGGNVEGGAVIGEQTLEQFLVTQQGENAAHVTIIDDGKGGQTFVISQGEAPAGVAKWSDIVALGANADANWTGLTGEIAENDHVSLGKLVLNAGSDGNLQELTIKANAVLEVKEIVMNAYARITVEPGAQFIVTGTQGIVAPVVDNIILQASETDQAVFLFNPAVTSNRHPNATVQMYAKAHHAADGTWFSQHFGIPTFETPAITWAPGTTYLYKFEESGWVNITSLDQLEPFVGYSVNNTSASAAGVYTFKGQLNGNTDAPLKFVKTNYNLVANSYAAPMALSAVFADLKEQYGSAVELSAWIYKSDDDRHVSVTKAGVDNDEDPTAIKTIAPMQGFILYCGASQPADGAIGYKEAVWENPNKTGVAIMAPARRAEDNSVRATIVVSTEKSKDQVVLRENDEYSSAFDNGADAHKYMSERVFDLYSEKDGENYSDVATDNLEGTTLTLKAKNETAYTMSFRNVNNFNYVVRDNLSGAIIPVEEGTTYDFYMAEGAVANGRFEIVGRQNMPTAIDNIEAVKSAKGVYTITGQYVGEASILNTLPAGIYVVDGQRIVK